MSNITNKFAIVKNIPSLSLMLIRSHCFHQQNPRVVSFNSGALWVRLKLHRLHKAVRNSVKVTQQQSVIIISPLNWVQFYSFTNQHEDCQTPQAHANESKVQPGQFSFTYFQMYFQIVHKTKPACWRVYWKCLWSQSSSFSRLHGTNHLVGLLSHFQKKPQI